MAALAKQAGYWSGTTEQSATFSAAVHVPLGYQRSGVTPPLSTVSWIFKMTRWRGRSRRTTCAMRAYLGEQRRGRNSDFLAERLANRSYSPGLWYWLCATPGVWMLPAVQQQLLHGFAVGAQFVLSEVKHSWNLWLWCKNWVVKVLWTSCGSQSNRVTVNLECDVCGLLKGERVSDFNKVISFNTSSYACSIQIHPVSDWRLNPVCGLAVPYSVWCLWIHKMALGPRINLNLPFPLLQLVRCYKW